MSELRDKIGSAIHDARHGMAIDDTTDQILEIIAEAMLSDEAVEAACRGSINARFSGWDAWAEVLNTPIAPPERQVANGIHFDTGEPDDVRRQEAAGIKAALQAAGITPGDAREGGETNND